MTKKIKFKKSIAVFVTVLMIMSVFAPAVNAINWYYPDMRYPDENLSVHSYQEVKPLEEYVDLDKFRQFIFDAFYDMDKTYVSVADFKIPYELASAVRYFIWYQMPEAFQIYGLGIGNTSVDGKSIVSSISVSFSPTAAGTEITPDEYHEQYLACEEKAAMLLDGIIGNNELDEVEKILLVHDRLVSYCEYSYSDYLAGTLTRPVYQINGILLNATGVCQGYALTMTYLLHKLGIESTYCSSDAMNHGWNIIFIDGKPYILDATHDDPVWDATGRVYHSNLLVSKDGYYNSSFSHRKDDYDQSAIYTTYDNYFWHNSKAAFQLLNGDIYYIDNENKTVNRLNDITTGSSAVITSIDYTWQSGSTFYLNNYSYLGTDGESLLYSTPKSIYKLDVNTGVSTAIWTPDEAATEDANIYGFYYDGAYLTCVVNTDANYDENTKAEHTIKKLYDVKAPEVETVITNNFAQTQTVTFSMKDNVAVDGYYWGTNSDYTKNAYVATSEAKISKTVSDAGTYYLTVKDSSGNVSETSSVTFYKTELNGNGGVSAAPAYVLTQEGKSFTLPKIERNGYNFNGWAIGSNSAADYEAGFEYAPSSSLILNALWSCKHEKYDSKTLIDATCTEDGLIEYTCTTCHEKHTEVAHKTGHNYGKWIITKEASCKEEGSKKKVCANCGDVVTEVIGKLPHTVVVDSAVAATCTSEGKTEGSHCSVCGTVFVAQNSIAKLPHTPVTDAAVAPTCAKEGKTEGSHCSVCGTVLVAQNPIAKLPHTPVTDAAVAPTCAKEGKTEGSHCSVCGTVLVAQKPIEKLPHTPVTDAAVAPTCATEGKTEGSHCSVCSAVLVAQKPIAKLPHSYGEWVEVKATTCKEAGLKQRVCSVCNDVATETIAKLPHTPVTDAAVAPTCTESGFTEGIHCSVCSAVIVARDTVPATGHRDANNDGYCDSCSEELSKICSCSCHKSGIVKFFWKIANFFRKLFKMEKYHYCDCGVAHW